MPFTKVTTSQHPYYDAVACVVWSNWSPEATKETTTGSTQQLSKPYGMCVVGESTTELLEFNTQRWSTLPHCNGIDGSSSTACALASVGSHIYQVGGLKGIPNEVTNACHCLEFGATEWKTLPGMQQSRCYAAVIGMGSSLYVVGGRGRPSSSSTSSDGSAFFTQLNSVEVFDTTTQEWTTKAPMLTPRMAPAIVALDEKTIAVLGGYSDRGEWETSVECYDISTDTWTTPSSNIPTMATPIAFPKAVTTMSKNSKPTVDRILVVGTSILRPMSTHGPHTSILSLNYSNRLAASNKWIKLVTSNPKHRSKFLLPNEGCAVALDPDSGTLYSVGGRIMKAIYVQSGTSTSTSKQVLTWKIPPDETMLVKDLQGSNSGLPVLGVGSNGHASPPARKQQRRQSLNRRMSSSGASNNGNARPITSIPLSIREVEEDACSQKGSGHGQRDTVVISPISTGTGRQAGRQLQLERQALLAASFPSISSLNDNNNNSGDNDGEENEPIETMHSTDIEWTDRSGTMGRYTGEIQTADGPYPLAPHGKGTFISIITKDTFEGEWKNGKRHGQGRWTFNATGDIFEGRFIKDRKHGRGTYQWRDGRCFEGNYENDQAEDMNGTLTWKNGTLYVGAFRKGQRTGKGTLHFPSNNVSYVGEFRNGKYDGYGVCTFEDSKVYSGYWRKGQAQGVGKLVGADGTVIHDGEWEDDAPIY